MIPATCQCRPKCVRTPGRTDGHTCIGAPSPIDGAGNHTSQYDHVGKVISSVGPLRLDVQYPKPLRDEVDALVVSDLVTQKHRHLNYQQLEANGLSNGGFGTLISTPAPTDTDRDGMPDYWEKAVGLNPAVDDHNSIVPCVFAYVPGSVGYTSLEDYLQWLAIPHGVVAKRTGAADTSLDVDMARFTSGLKPGAVYTVSSAVGGTVSIAADGHTARFVPDANFIGRAGFNFSGTDQQKKVGTLSGGERNRVHLAKMLRSGANLILLDEPTNDLDVHTLRALEEGLENFAGCAVIISHDRWFLDRVATHMLAFEGESQVVWFPGTYSEYEEDRHKRLGAAADRPHRITYRKLTR